MQLYFHPDNHPINKSREYLRMFDNKYIADKLLILSKLLEVNGEDSSRILTYKKGADLVRGLNEPVKDFLEQNKQETLFILFQKVFDRFI